jgi:hypothetical protein
VTAALTLREVGDACEVRLNDIGFITNVQENCQEPFGDVSSPAAVRPWTHGPVHMECTARVLNQRVSQ